jgi:hypothetical protein
MIVIGTTPDRSDWLKDCVNSLREPCLVISDFNFELGKLNWASKQLSDRFFFFQDSVVFKQSSWIFELLENYEHVALTSDPVVYGTYMGIYDPKILREIETPIPRSKKESIDYEISWTKTYIEKVGSVHVAFPELTDANATRKEMKYGRENLVLENDYIIKFKGDWGQIVH